MDLRRGVSLKVLPYTFPKNVRATKENPFIKAGTTTWFSPSDRLPKAVEHQHALYITNVFSLLYGDVKAGNTERVNIFFDKMKKYQQVSGGNSLPSSVQYRAERILNGFPFATILFMVNLTLGFIALLYTIYRITRQRSLKAFDIALPALLGISFLALTFGLAMRWIVSGNVPMSNGYESMLTVAWFVMLISLVMQWRIRLVMVFGFLLSGFFLLVSHINQMDPAIGQMMPVLNSPLLSIHVSIIMMSYALLSLTFLCGVMGIFLRSHGEELQALSRVPLSCPCHHGVRHLHRCNLGKRELGQLLELGFQGNLGAHHLYDLCRGGSYTEPVPVPQAPRLPRLHDPCLPEHRHDIFRSKLLPHRHALVCLRGSFSPYYHIIVCLKCDND